MRACCRNPERSFQQVHTVNVVNVVNVCTEVFWVSRMAHANSLRRVTRERSFSEIRESARGYPQRSRGSVGDIPDSSRGLTSRQIHKMWRSPRGYPRANHKMWGLRFFKIFSSGGRVVRLPRSSASSLWWKSVIFTTRPATQNPNLNWRS